MRSASDFTRIASVILLAGSIAIVSWIAPWIPEAFAIDPVHGVPRQPLEAAVGRLLESMQSLGDPIPEKVVSDLQALRDDTDDTRVVSSIQSILDPICLADHRKTHVSEGDAVVSKDQKCWHRSRQS